MMQTKNVLFKILGIWTHGLALFRLRSGREVLWILSGVQIHDTLQHEAPRIWTNMRCSDGYL